MYKFLKIKKYTNSNGTLIPVYLKKFSNFKMKRFFFINGKKKSIRGKHAHKKCTQIFIPIKGKTELRLIKKNEKKIILDSNSLKILRVPPLTWCEVKFLDNNCIIMVLCDIKFSQKEYIRKFKTFSKLLG